MNKADKLVSKCKCLMFIYFKTIFDRNASDPLNFYTETSEVCNVLY